MVQQEHNKSPPNARIEIKTAGQVCFAEVLRKFPVPEKIWPDIWEMNNITYIFQGMGNIAY